MEAPSVGELDAWLVQAKQCKYLLEPEMKALCDFVRSKKIQDRIR